MATVANATAVWTTLGAIENLREKHGQMTSSDYVSLTRRREYVAPESSYCLVMPPRVVQVELVDNHDGPRRNPMVAIHQQWRKATHTAQK